MMFSIYQKRGDHNKTLEYIDKCLEAVGTQQKGWGDLALKKANVLVAGYLKTSDQEYLEKGIKQFEIILERQPDNSSVLNNLAYLLADNNTQLQKAVEYAKRAYEQIPDNASTIDTYAYTLCKTAQYEKAAEMLQMAIQIHDRNNTPVPWDTYEHLGMAYEGFGQNTDAGLAYNQALEASSNRISENNKKRLEDAIVRVLQ